MKWLDPLNDPDIAYLVTWARVRVRRAREETERSRGASAIEWAIITGILALIAITIGGIILNKVKSAANDIKTK